jgi:transposase
VIFTRGLRVCLAVEPVDFRKSFEGLALVVKGVLGEDERSSKIFVFTNRKRDRIRLLCRDGGGLWLPAKKLGMGNFSWPDAAAAHGRVRMRIKSESLEMLLSGIDLKGARMRPWYEDTSGLPEESGEPEEEEES